ncbi:periplasmic protein [Candidatus Scalindua japonica]|uniref:Periplasmic protein n=1 Tax=Candidatus Scalindua japonica TaxID=1284222 RepID=A0A286U496_9BACT|nr:polysaccharide biosynthesis/export family protein [Candidatus Scalindua japonica]GAX62944.1 periplasmic protein [Candidatus Scalindua japonica]
MIRNVIILISLVLVLFHTGCTTPSSSKLFDEIPKLAVNEQNEEVDNRLEAINGTYKLSPPDVVAISVNDNKDLNTAATIRPDGNIFFPLLGDIYIEGLTPLEVREKIHKLLGRYLKELPAEAVSVQVRGFNSKKVYIYSFGGGIRQIPFTGNLTVLDAITKTGLLSRTAKRSKIKVIRGESDVIEKPQSLVVNLNDILKKGKTGDNIVLRPNDIVYIPPTLLGRIGFVIQDVLKPTQPAQQLGSAAASAGRWQTTAFGFDTPGN